MVGVVRDVVEQHQPRADRVLEVEHVEARRRLVQPIAIPRASKPSRLLITRRIVALCDTTSTFWPGCDSMMARMTGNARAMTSTPHSPPGGRHRERIFFPTGVFDAKALLHVLPREPFPVAVVDLTQPRPRDRRQFVRFGDEGRGFDGPAHRRAVHGGDRIVGQPGAQARGLMAALVGKRDIGRSGKSVLGAERGGAVTNEQQPCGHEPLETSLYLYHQPKQLSWLHGLCTVFGPESTSPHVARR